MRVSHLTLKDFRNYSGADVAFSPGLNLVLGRNGQGKTNLVEAISYFSHLSSHRVTTDSALLRSGQESAVARMQVVSGERNVLLELQLNRSKPNRAQLNRNAVRPRELTRWFTSVLFAPEDLTLVRGEPSVRRRFLDETAALRNPTYSSTLNEYDRVVKQRSALLKSARNVKMSTSMLDTLGIWDTQLVQLGITIMLERRALVDAIRDPLQMSYHSIVEQNHLPRVSLIESVFEKASRGHVSRETTGDEKNSFETGIQPHVSRETLSEDFLRSLTAVRSQELDRGMTLIGPHRDDLLLELNSLPVKGYASHGETWSFVLALRLAVAQLMRTESFAGDPVIILDDVFAELDVRRRNALMRQVAEFEQVIVTAAVEGDVPEGGWKIVRVESGVAKSGESA